VLEAKDLNAALLGLMQSGTRWLLNWSEMNLCSRCFTCKRILMRKVVEQSLKKAQSVFLGYEDDFTSS
jgi:hypothetical protein